MPHVTSTTALYAAALALPLAAAATAPPIVDNAGHAFLTGTLLGSGAAGRGDHLEVQSWHWGAGATPASGGRNTLASDDTPGAEPAPIEDMPKNLEAKEKMGDYSRSSGHSMLGASEKVTVGAGRSETGQATGQRVHKPLRIRAYYDQPLARGSLTLTGAFPRCAEGTHFPTASFISGGKLYALEDIAISECAPGAVTLDYRKVTVRGWDPEKKEE
jgi:hypothetical protein